MKPASLDPGSNWGTLILDATCVPDDIPYPVDLRLLAESRDTTERVIDELFKQLQGKIARKPRCNSVKAHKLFLTIIKKKKPSHEEIREVKRFQINEISRNLKAIDGMIHCGAELSALSSQLYRKLLIASEVTRQQQEMVDADSRRIDDRIVNLSKPHVRPIVRGMAGKKTEFGALARRASACGRSQFPMLMALSMWIGSAGTTTMKPTTYSHVLSSIKKSEDAIQLESLPIQSI